MFQTQPAYPNPSESRSENSAPHLSLEVQQVRTPRKYISDSALHLDLNALYNEGLIAKFVDENGVERYRPVGEES